MKKNLVVKYPILVLMLLCIAAVACTADARLPEDARESLEKQWSSLPVGESDSLQIASAKKGKKPVSQPLDDSSNRETWCVEVSLPDELIVEDGPLTMTWIVTRIDKDSDWMVSPLMVMSSLWPYEACGEMPGGLR